MNAPHNYRHGMSNARVYRIWRSMRQRCLNKRCSRYASYGGRGIRICERWSKFEAFLSDLGEPTALQSLDRVNVNGDYGPDNCRWATPNEQQRNKRNSLVIFAFGELKTAAAWAEDSRCSVHRGVIAKRIAAGTPAEAAISMPSRQRRALVKACA